MCAAHMSSSDLNRVHTANAVHKVVRLIDDHNVSFQFQTNRVPSWCMKQGGVRKDNKLSGDSSLRVNSHQMVHQPRLGYGDPLDPPVLLGLCA